MEVVEGPRPEPLPRMDSASHDLAELFYTPCLKWATRYQRAVGFFTSGWLRANAAGMAPFVARGGRARWITSPILSESDLEALCRGAWGREALTRALDLGLDEIEERLENETLNMMAWMIADEIIDMRFAVPTGKLEGGDFHDKFGIFGDEEGNRLSYNGSVNDSLQGTRNYESIKVFCSWRLGQEAWVQDDEERFGRLWEGLESHVQIFSLPDAIRARIFRLRTQERPYPPPKLRLGPEGPNLPPDIHLRAYQEAAIAAWEAAGRRGLLAMATGAGKTLTSIWAATRAYADSGRLALVVGVPYQHIGTQWAAVVQRFGWAPVLCFGGRSRWEEQAHKMASHYKLKVRKHICLIVVYDTFMKDSFRAVMDRAGGPTLFIADEAHHLGATNRRTRLPEEAGWRMGLSATPLRRYDGSGTAAIFQYFQEIVYEFSLAQAIQFGCLTPYYYHPHVVELTELELEDYIALSRRIGRRWHMAKGDLEDDHLGALLNQRARILTGAENKLSAFATLLEQQPIQSHALVYVEPAQIDGVVRLLADRGVLTHRFTQEESNEVRQKLLEDFASGRLQALVAMRCLDEGVDVPEARTAYILASSSNPRQFIQRRGRVLRRATNKQTALVHDFFVVPALRSLDEEEDPSGAKAERAILRRELERFHEFADHARNTFRAREAIRPIMDAFRLRTLPIEERDP